MLGLTSEKKLQDAIKQLDAANKKVADLEATLSNNAAAAKQEIDRMSEEVKQANQRAEQAKARNQERDLAIIRMANAEGWHNFDDNWFDLDTVTHFKTKKVYPRSSEERFDPYIGVQIINGQDITTEPPVADVLAVLMEHKRSRKKAGAKGGDTDSGAPMPPKPPLPVAPTPRTIKPG